ncbi:MAG: IS66 family transposase [Aggregatilineales bacterium]
MTPINLPSGETIHSAYVQGESAIQALFEAQGKYIRALEAQLHVLESRVQALEDQLNKNSRNSSQPPSSDGLKKPQPKSQRGRSGKTRGSQKGHEGQTLKAVAEPDEVIVHQVTHCAHCQADLQAVAATGLEKRQVFELPPMGLVVTEHQAEHKHCPLCGKTSRATFPADVTQPTQYGPRFRAQLVYFHSGQFIPLARTAKLVEGLYQQLVSEATIVTAVTEAARRVEPVNDGLKTYLVETAEAVHFDETGTRVNAKLHWLHAAGTTQATVYNIHAKRGGLGMDAAGILNRRRGWSVYDGWKPYFNYPVKHALCNAHYLRELTFIAEQYQQQWAVDMRHQLCQIKTAVETARAEGRTSLFLEQIAYFNHRYTNILDDAQDELETSPPSDSAPRHKNHPAANLLKRLIVGRASVLAFMSDFSVPFDNNLAERDVRMMKVQQKVSGGFRQLAGAQAFCAVRGYMETSPKRGLRLYNRAKWQMSRWRSGHKIGLE